MEKKTPKHTPEPWKAQGCYIIDEKSRFIVVTSLDTTLDTDVHNIARIVECVNALSGIDDPKEWVENVKQGLDDYDLLNHLLNKQRGEIEQLKAKEIKGDRLLVKYSHEIVVLKAERSAAIQEVCKLTYIVNELEGRLKDLQRNF